jgi:hypothetical protein
MWHRVLWWKFTDVSEERRQISTRWHGVTHQKTVFFFVASRVLVPCGIYISVFSHCSKCVTAFSYRRDLGLGVFESLDVLRHGTIIYVRTPMIFREYVFWKHRGIKFLVPKFLSIGLEFNFLRYFTRHDVKYILVGLESKIFNKRSGNMLVIWLTYS